MNLLGTREPGIYGTDTLRSVEGEFAAYGSKRGVVTSSFQSNSEGGLVDAIHNARVTGVDAIVINAGAYTHTSVALRDALGGCDIPFIEVRLQLLCSALTVSLQAQRYMFAQVHISNVHTREPFRHHSYLSDKAVAVMAGLGKHGYEYALEHFVRTGKKRPAPILLD